MVAPCAPASLTAFKNIIVNPRLKTYLYIYMNDVLPPLLRRFGLGGSEELRRTTDLVLEELLNSIDADILVPALSKILMQPDSGCFIPALVMIKNILEQTTSYFESSRNTHDVLAALVTHLSGSGEVRNCSAELIESIFKLCPLTFISSVSTMKVEDIDSLCRILPSLKGELGRRNPESLREMSVSPPLFGVQQPLFPSLEENIGDTPSAAQADGDVGTVEGNNPLERMSNLVITLPSSFSKRALAKHSAECKQYLTECKDDIPTKDVEDLIQRICSCSVAEDDVDIWVILIPLLEKCTSFGISDGSVKRVYSFFMRMNASYSTKSRSSAVKNVVDSLQKLKDLLKEDPSRFLSVLVSIATESTGSDKADALSAIKDFCLSFDPVSLIAHMPLISETLKPLLDSEDEDVRRESIVCFAECAIILGEEQFQQYRGVLNDVQQRVLDYYVLRGSRRIASQRSSLKPSVQPLSPYKL